MKLLVEYFVINVPAEPDIYFKLRSRINYCSFTEEPLSDFGKYLYFTHSDILSKIRGIIFIISFMVKRLKSQIIKQETTRLKQDS